MASQFSDPAWWPKPPPKPPKPISAAKIVFGTLVPGAALIAGAFFVLTQHSSKSPGASTQSIAAFDACLRTRGYSPADAGSTAARQAVQACAARLPPGTHVGSFGAQSTEQEQFNDCVRNATADLPGGGGSGVGRFGRGGSGARQAFENAVEVCQTLIRGGSSTTLEPTTPTATSPTAPPAA